MKHILVIAQSIDQPYINQLAEALGEDCVLDVVSGNEISGDRINWIQSPKHNPKSVASRLNCWLRHLSFIRKWARKQHNSYCLIFAVSNPPINSYIGLRLKRRFNVPFVYMNWDLYPQIIETSIDTPVAKLFCFLWKRWNKKNYPKIDRMITIGSQMAKSILMETKANINLSVIPLGVNSNFLVPIEKKENRFLINNNLSEKFVVLFSGKMGIGHNIEIILRASKKIACIKDIVFVFIGDGPKYQIVEDFINENKAENVRLFPWQDSDIYPYSIACGDIAIVTEEKTAEGLMLPSRVFSMMSCGEAIIGVCGKNDDLFSIIKDNQIGDCVINNQEDELCSIILRLYGDKKLLEEMKKNARKLIECKYSVSEVTKEYKNMFTKLRENVI